MIPAEPSYLAEMARTTIYSYDQLLYMQHYIEAIAWLRFMVIAEPVMEKLLESTHRFATGVGLPLLHPLVRRHAVALVALLDIDTEKAN